MDKESDTSQPPAPWVIVPPTVLGDVRLSAGEKIVYGRVFGFIERFGYCRASNEYLGKYIGMSKNTVRNYLSRLYELGYLRYELIRNSKREVVERRIYPTLVLPQVLPSTTPSTPGGTKEITRKNKKNVDCKNDDEAEVRYYAELLADTLRDEKSLSYYLAACRRHNPQRLLEKAKQIISDGGARNPAAVFVAWLKKG
jgi:DNA-binding transcriptional ArsR family regulator